MYLCWLLLDLAKRVVILGNVEHVNGSGRFYNRNFFKSIDSPRIIVKI
jgi:hypothetical protein